MDLRRVFAEVIVVDIEVGSSLVQKTVVFVLHVQHNSLSRAQEKRTYYC